ncbi:MAG: hypothetical protein IT186_04135 [Acidobacteria bacterium]|nr:hypothetical protein [Acidobacteriota bacterium]
MISLVCRMCGGPWPCEAGLPSPAQRCSYCGHPASATPGVKAALRLFVKQPARLPAPLRSLATFWIVALAGLSIVLALGLLRPPRGVLFRETVPLPAGIVAGPGTHALGIQSRVIRVEARSRAFPHIAVSAPDLRDGRLCLLTRLTHLESGGSVTGWLALWDGEPPHPGYPARHPWAELSLSGSGRVHPLPKGDYHIELLALVFLGPSPPTEVVVEMTTMAEPAIGLLILLLNAFPWLLVVDLRASAGRLTGRAPWPGRMARFLFAALLLLVLLEHVHPVNPLGTKGALAERTAGDPPRAECGSPASQSQTSRE